MSELDVGARTVEAARVRRFLDPAPGGSDPLAEARAAGFAEGIAEGRRRALAEIEADHRAALERLAVSLGALARLEETLVRRHEQRLLDLVLEAASRVVRRRIEEGDAVARRALEEAMESLPASAGLRARLHPSDVEPVARELSAEVDRGRIEIVPDASVSRGGVILESAVGTVDATLETALAAVRAAAMGAPEEP